MILGLVVIVLGVLFALNIFGNPFPPSMQGRWPMTGRLFGVELVVIGIVVVIIGVRS
jgi:hypothetical protein